MITDFVSLDDNRYSLFKFILSYIYIYIYIALCFFSLEMESVTRVQILDKLRVNAIRKGMSPSLPLFSPYPWVNSKGFLALIGEPVQEKEN